MGLFWALNNKYKYCITSKKKDIDKCIYGLYKGEECFYIGKTNDLKRRYNEHKRNNENFIIKELKKPNNELNWEKIYIQWYGMKYKLINKEFKIKQHKISIKDRNRLTLEYYPKYRDNFYEIQKKLKITYNEIKDLIYTYHLY